MGGDPVSSLCVCCFLLWAFGWDCCEAAESASPSNDTEVALGTARVARDLTGLRGSNGGAAIPEASTALGVEGVGFDFHLVALPCLEK